MSSDLSESFHGLAEAAFPEGANPAPLCEHHLSQPLEMSVFVCCPVGLRGHEQQESTELLTVTNAKNTSCVVITHSSYSGYTF